MRITESRLRRIIRSVIKEVRLRNRPNNIGYEKDGMTSAELIRERIPLRGTHAEFDKNFVIICDVYDYSYIEVEDLALEFDPSCNLNDKYATKICATQALKSRGIITISDTQFPGELYDIDNYLDCI